MDRQLLNVARLAAAAASRTLLAGSADLGSSRPGWRVKEKTSHADLVTDIDEAAEAALVEVLRREVGPDHRILGEETFSREGGSLEAAEALATSTQHLWIVDPLDGTTNFVHGVPFFAISIAYLHYGEVRVALIVDVLRGDRYEAIRGQGVWKNEKPIRVSEEERLYRALVATGFPFDPTTQRRLNLDRFQRVARKARNVRVMGSAALTLALIASGQLNGYWDLRLGPWDMAAGKLLVEESGGRVTNLAGGPVSLFHGEVVASNGRIHEELLAALAE